MARVAQELGFSIWIVTFGTISGIPESSFSIAISKYCGKRGTPKYSFSIANLTFVAPDPNFSIVTGCDSV